MEIHVSIQGTKHKQKLFFLQDTRQEHRNRTISNTILNVLRIIMTKF